MLDTKWKNNKNSSFLLPAIAISAAVSILFMSLFPLFQKKAEESYIDPLTEQDFISDLFAVNLVQYKYLREKADQKQYEYSDLYLETKIQNTYNRTEDDESESFSDSYTDMAMQTFLSSQRESINSQCMQFEGMLSSLGEMMDYYVEDLNSGTILSNSGTSLPDALSEQQADADKKSDYLYYLSLQYDSAGNISNVNVRCRDNAKQFLSRVQNAGHDFPLKLQEDVPSGYTYNYEANGRMADYTVYDEYNDMFAAGSIHLTLMAPSNMRVIYGLTQAQYTELMKPDNYYEYMSNFQSLHFAGRNSYYQAGIAPAYLLFLLAAAVIGFFLCRKRILHNEEAINKIGRIPLEFTAAAVVLLFMASSQVIQFVYEFQNDLFLRNVRAGIGLDGKLGFLPLDKTIMFLLLLIVFLLAFLIGTNLSGFGRGYLKKHSLICRYWTRIVGKVREVVHDFYTDLVTYDIGTDANRIILKVIAVNFGILLIICCFWFAGIFGLIIYSVIIYFILKRYVKDIQSKYRKLLNATSSIAQGNLDTALSENFGIFESYKSQLWQIQADFKRAVNEEVKSQRMKTELITNVSHDLKTPLTAIITYIELLRDPSLPDEKRKEYLDILQRKANRLKVLIEDLFEISKASSKSVTLQIVDVDICNLLRQAYLEQDDRISSAGLDFKFSLPDEKIILPLDSQKTYRIFDNLYSNIVKYALSGTRVYILLKNEADYVQIELKNISATELSVAAEELTERFVRGDDARNTEGSGLGLAIAKSFAELQGGSMKIDIDGDLFKVILRFKKKNTDGAASGEEKAAAQGVTMTFGDKNGTAQQPGSGFFPGNNGYYGTLGYGTQNGGPQGNGYGNPNYYSPRPMQQGNTGRSFGTPYSNNYGGYPGNNTVRPNYPYQPNVPNMDWQNQNAPYPQDNRIIPSGVPLNSGSTQGPEPPQKNTFMKKRPKRERRKNNKEE